MSYQNKYNYTMDFESHRSNNQIKEKDFKKDLEIKRDHLTTFRKVIILILVTISGMLAPLASTIYLPSINLIQEDLKTSSSIIDISISVFLFTIAICPLFWGSLSDAYGRRNISVITQLLLIIGCFGCALAQNVETLIFMRILTGIGSSAYAVIGVGIINDIYNSKEKGRAMGVFFIGPTFGPSLGPLIGGIINEYCSWRVNFWALGGFSCLLFILNLIFVKETLDEGKKKSVNIESMNRFPYVTLKGELINPLSSLKLFIIPKIVLILLYGGIMYGSYYNISVSQTRIMDEQYNLTSIYIGLSYLPGGAGNMIGSYLGGFISDFIMKRNKTRNPEVRLHGAWIGTAFVMIGLFLMGFHVEYEHNLALVLLAQFIIGLGMASVFTITSTYLTDISNGKPSSVTACTNFVRFFLSGLVTSFNSGLLESLGPLILFLIFSLLQLFGFIVLAYLTFSWKDLFSKKKNASETSIIRVDY